jgi:hypothetical protein
LYLVGVLVLLAYHALKPSPVYVSHHHLEESIWSIGILALDPAAVIDSRTFREQCYLLEGILIHTVEPFLQEPKAIEKRGIRDGERVSLEFPLQQIGDFPDYS